MTPADTEDNTDTQLEPTSFLDNHLYGFAYKIIRAGSKFPYQLNMLFQVDEAYIYCDRSAHFNRFMDETLLRNGELRHWALYWYLRRFTVTSLFLKFSAYMALAVVPFYLKELIDWLMDPKALPGEGYRIVGVMIFAMFVKIVLNTRAILNNMRGRAFISNALGGYIAHKVSKLPPMAQRYVDFGRVSFFIHGDLNKITWAMTRTSHMLCFPPLIIIYSALIIHELGWVGYLAPAIIAFTLLIQRPIVTLLYKLDRSRRRMADRRAGLVNEAVTGIKNIKFNAWEYIIQGKSSALRKKESKKICCLYFTKALADAILSWNTAICGLVCFVVYHFYVGPISVSQAYTVLMLLNMMQAPFDLVLTSYMDYISSTISLARMSVMFNIEDYVPRMEDSGMVKGSMVIEEGSFSWEDAYYKRKLEVLATGSSGSVKGFEGDEEVGDGNEGQDGVVGRGMEPPGSDFGLSCGDKKKKSSHSSNNQDAEEIDLRGKDEGDEELLLGNNSSESHENNNFPNNSNISHHPIESKKRLSRDVVLVRSNSMDEIPAKKGYLKPPKPQKGRISKPQEISNNNNSSSGASSVDHPPSSEDLNNASKATPEDPPFLKSINLKADPGEFIAIVGKVGSGKSSLLYSILDQMNTVSGRIRHKGKIAHISQEPFLLNNTLRNNILFGKEYNEAVYNHVLDICQLRPDIRILPGGDLTEIGERGINLSGGQKQRICIARAVYSNSDIYLIDDCLSALDAYVGKAILNKVFLEYLKDKTRIMATHLLQFLGQTDSVVFMKEGEIFAQAKFEVLQKNYFYLEFAEKHESGRKGVDDDDRGDLRVSINPFSESKRSAEADLLGINRRAQDQENEGNMAEIDQNEPSQPLETTGSTLALKLINQANIETIENNNTEINVTVLDETSDGLQEGKLTKKEARYTGQVGIDVYWFYLSQGGCLLTTLTLLFYTLSVSNQVLVDWWIGKWSQKGFPSLSQIQYIQIYTFLVIAFLLTFWLKFSTYGTFSSKVSLNIFKKMFWNILRRPMNFFDTTPSGLVLNRCTNDVEVVDYDFPIQFGKFQDILFSVLATFLLAAVASPAVLGIIFVNVVAFSVLLRMYLKTSMELKRLFQMSKSPILSTVSEMMNGSCIIRSFGYTKAILGRWKKFHNASQSVLVHDNYSQIWIQLAVEISIGIFALTFGLLVVVGKTRKINLTEDASTLALIITYIFSLSNKTVVFVVSLGQVANSMSVVQRLKEYIDWKEFEAPLKEPPTDTLNWPTKGEIKFEDLSVQYRKGLPKVIKNLSFDIEPTSKVAIVGRTGSGKSTLLLCLMRILENLDDDGLRMGSIRIDDVDIATLGLNKLRRNITIIPQDPYLFEGTLRFNVDPMNIYTDEEVIESLSKVKLWETIRQRQLLAGKSTPKVRTKRHGGGDYGGGSGTRGGLRKGQNSETEERSDYRSEALEGLTPEEKLGMKIETKGKNLSVGQRQLICIARALIEKPKILLMDEATANIDQRTDSIIQEVIQHHMEGSTVVTIAHRLVTIIKYDKLIVLKDGEKVEEGAPLGLIESGGYFCKLVEEGGTEFKQRMLDTAREASGVGGFDLV